MNSATDHSSIFHGGRLLLAAPTLREPTFARSVIYLVEHTDKGAAGMILNRPSGNTVGDLVNDPDFAAVAKLPVYMGGPVDKHTLSFAAFWWDAAKSELTVEKLTSVNQTAQYAAMADPRLFVRAFAGYSGWSAGQLETELEAKGWITSDTPDVLLTEDHSQNLWSDVLRTMSAHHQLLAECPLDPFAN